MEEYTRSLHISSTISPLARPSLHSLKSYPYDTENIKESPKKYYSSDYMHNTITHSIYNPTASNWRGMAYKLKTEDIKREIWQTNEIELNNNKSTFANNYLPEVTSGNNEEMELEKKRLESLEREIELIEHKRINREEYKPLQLKNERVRNNKTHKTTEKKKEIFNRTHKSPALLITLNKKLKYGRSFINQIEQEREERKLNSQNENPLRNTNINFLYFTDYYKDLRNTSCLNKMERNKVRRVSLIR